MSTVLSSRRLRWAVPGGVAAAVVVASLTSSVNASAGTPRLAPRTAAQLVVSMQKAQPPLLSGTIVETTHLGLPDLSAFGTSSGGDADLTLQNFVSGSHTLRIFYGGADKQRFALLGSLSESDVIHNGTDLWTYSSSTRAVTHATLKTPDAKPETLAPAVAGLTPMAEAQKALAEIDPSTAVTVDNNVTIAGRSAYQLKLVPKDTRSLVGSVQIALDSATSVPLRVQVYARGASDPAIQVGFTDISFGAPDASIFNFTPPAGTTTTQSKIPFVGDAEHAKAAVSHDQDGSKTTVIGSGWTSVVELTLPSARSVWDSSNGQLLSKVATRVDGGWLVTSSLVSVLLTQDGHVYAGTVSGADLQQVAATGKAL